MFVGAGFFGWEGPAVALASGIERALRMSAAEAAMMDRRKKSRSRVYQIPPEKLRKGDLVTLTQSLSMAPSKVIEGDEFVNIWMDTGVGTPSEDKENLEKPTEDFYGQWVVQSTSCSIQCRSSPFNLYYSICKALSAPDNWVRVTSSRPSCN